MLNPLDAWSNASCLIVTTKMITDIAKYLEEVGYLPHVGNKCNILVEKLDFNNFLFDK